jgi:hypothetical protein
VSYWLRVLLWFFVACAGPQAVALGASSTATEESSVGEDAEEMVVSSARRSPADPSVGMRRHRKPQPAIFVVPAHCVPRDRGPSTARPHVTIRLIFPSDPDDDDDS